MNKRGILPLIILLPLVIIGLVVLYFILKSLIGILLTTIIWVLGIGFVVIAGIIIYYLISWAIKKKGGRRK